MSTITTRHKGNVSLTRVVLAIFTCGLSLPFVGIRRRTGRSITTVR